MNKTRVARRNLHGSGSRTIVCSQSFTRTPLAVMALLLIAKLNCFPAMEIPPDSPSSHRYEHHAVHDPDGIGKFYMGREIAQVMGHQGADWLERPEREGEEHTEQLVGLLNLKAGDVVADIGAGTGYLTRRLATRVAPTGKVFAVDIQPEMLQLLTNNMAGAGITNVVPLLGTVSNPNLPAASVDLVLMVDVYHEFEFPFEMMSQISRALKPGGRVAFVEFRAEDPRVPIKPLHKMSEAQVRKEMAAVSLQWIRTDEQLPRQHLVVFAKRS